MAIFRCKMCGGTLNISDEISVIECEYCGTKQTLPRLDNEKKANLYDRANHFRRNNEFDKAMGIYEQILNEDNTDAEAYWSLVLCRYGIEYVEDPTSHKHVPTINRAQFTSIFDDDNYKSALHYADTYQKSVYEEEANTINEIQKGILAISQKEEPFDVFICYKETDNNGRRTPDSVLANDLYHQLTQEGFKVFFARITLEDKLGSAYEPYIFAALNSSKVMVALGTKPEFFNAVWVKNEWSRYLALIKNGAKKMLIPAYKDMDPYDLPEEFSHLQAQDMSKLGFMQDLIRGIKKIIQVDEPKQTVVKETVVTENNTNIDPLLERAFMFLEDGDWKSADEYCERVLDLEPKCAKAYLGKLMAELHIPNREELKNYKTSFENHNNYQKALRFADVVLAEELKGYIDFINDRNEAERLEKTYQDAVRTMKTASTDEDFYTANKLLKKNLSYKDSSSLAEECLEKAEELRKNDIYDNAKLRASGFEISRYEESIKLFESINGWKDAGEQIQLCRRKIEEIKAKEEADRSERERQAEIARKEAERIVNRNKKIMIVAIIVLAIIGTLIIAFNTFAVPAIKYNEAVDLMESGEYDAAIEVFESLDGYKDSSEQIEICNTAILDIKYNEAIELMNEEKYEDAVRKFATMNGYKDSSEQMEICNTAILDIKYNEAVTLMNEGKYVAAMGILKTLNGYKESNELYDTCRESVNVNEKNVDFRPPVPDVSTKRDGGVQVNSINVGDIFTFGSYEQDNNISNGKEDIEWLVLDKQNDKALLISKYSLDCQQYYTSYASVTWETCSIRKWLNSIFIDNAFSPEQQEMIQTTTVTADKNQKYEHDTNPGNATQDKVFLLSIIEANRYFSSEGARQCTSTPYAISQGVQTINNHSTICEWLLRSPGFGQSFVAVVDYFGEVYEYGESVYSKCTGIRPVMWIDLNS